MTSVAAGRSVRVADLVSAAKGAMHSSEMGAVTCVPQIQARVTLHGEALGIEDVLRQITDRGGAVTPGARDALRGFTGFMQRDVSGERNLAFVDRRELDLGPSFSADLVVQVGLSTDYGFSPCAPEALIHGVDVVMRHREPLSLAFMMNPAPKGLVFCCSYQQDHVSVYVLERERISSRPNLRFVFDITNKFPPA